MSANRSDFTRNTLYVSGGLRQRSATESLDSQCLFGWGRLPTILYILDQRCVSFKFSCQSKGVIDALPIPGFGDTKCVR